MTAQPAVNLHLPSTPLFPKLVPVSVPPRPPVTVIVPCYDEAEGIPTLLARLETLTPLGWEIVFVDDGSRDATFATLLDAARSRPWMRVVRHGTNLGLGAALRTGFARARGPIVCTMDSDCTYLPERLPELVGLIEQGADIATASPWHPESVPAEQNLLHLGLRLGLSRALSGLYRLLIGRDVHTFTCLHRAYRREVVDATRFRASGCAAVAELLLRGMLGGWRVREVPMQLGARRFGESKLKIGNAIVAHLGLLSLTAVVVWARWVRRCISARVPSRPMARSSGWVSSGSGAPAASISTRGGP
jgi:dolichol-phosphate mannosyltransferase